MRLRGITLCDSDQSASSVSIKGMHRWASFQYTIHLNNIQVSLTENYDNGWRRITVTPFAKLVSAWAIYMFSL